MQCNECYGDHNAQRDLQLLVVLTALSVLAVLRTGDKDRHKDRILAGEAKHKNVR